MTPLNASNSTIILLALHLALSCHPSVLPSTFHHWSFISSVHILVNGEKLYQSNRFEAMLDEEARVFLITRKESYIPSATGSIGSPVVRSIPTTLPSAYSSWRADTIEVSHEFRKRP